MSWVCDSARLASRSLAALALLSLAAGGATAAADPARTLSAADQLESQVLAELNAIRRAHGLVPCASRARSRRPPTRTRARWAPTASSATRPATARRSGSGSSASTARAAAGLVSGENLLWSTTGLDAAEALKLWMDSPGHRKNILRPLWREIGLSAVSVQAAPGVFGGRDVVIVTTDFGVRT